MATCANRATIKTRVVVNLLGAIVKYMDATDDDDGLAQDLKIEGKPVKGLHFTADYFKWEVLFRSCVQMLFGYVLTVAYLPNAVPTSGTFLIGIFASTCAVAVPHAMFTITAVYPLIIGMFIL